MDERLVINCDELLELLESYPVEVEVIIEMLKEAREENCSDPEPSHDKTGKNKPA
jgi:hypothetical protein